MVNGFSAWRDRNGSDYSVIIRSNPETSHSSFSFSFNANIWEHIVYTYTGTELIGYRNGNEFNRSTYGKNGKGSVVGTENSPVTVDTSNSKTFIDYVDDAKTGGKTIAYGDAIFKADGTTYINDPDFQTAETYKCNDWKQIEIPIVYYNTAQPVTHIIISGAASRFGDYFEGYNGSKLWIDNIELIYDDDLNVYKE
jgi:hypothetical protein